MEDIIFSFLPFSKGDTRVILVFAADICGILSILSQSMTRVSPFENGRNGKVMSYAVFQIMPVLPPEADKNLCGRTDIGPSPPCRTG